MASSSTWSKYSHHMQAATAKPKAATSAEPGLQLVSTTAAVMTTMDSPSTIRVNNPKRSGMWEVWPGNEHTVE